MNPFRFLVTLITLATAPAVLAAGGSGRNVLFIISDDLTLNALSC